MYLPKLQFLLKPFYVLARKNSKFSWTEEHEENFEKIKELLVQPPVLCAPQGKGDFYLYSDTSREITGASLFQDIHGRQRLVAYHSKTLPKSAKSFRQ